MKIFERILDRGIREIVKLSANQCGFVSGCGSVGAIHAAHLLMEKHCEKQKPVHMAFLDLEKAFDRVPCEVIWYALRQHNVPEELIEWDGPSRMVFPEAFGPYMETDYEEPVAIIRYL
ncbi:unnamed protein product [Heligmosomoides polygyrus]|uniref:Reverse transcriptase domain-containing protein n=1 Tax=Heligmosomoides polygyrus TaxID=6339 RepID=A0A183GPR0_HELPZ|nr:unnamed protein product [Heligmosomoides polygyrus]